MVFEMNSVTAGKLFPRGQERVAAFLVATFAKDGGLNWFVIIGSEGRWSLCETHVEYEFDVDDVRFWTELPEKAW